MTANVTSQFKIAGRPSVPAFDLAKEMADAYKAALGDSGNAFVNMSDFAPKASTLQTPEKPNPFMPAPTFAAKNPAQQTPTSAVYTAVARTILPQAQKPAPTTSANQKSDAKKSDGLFSNVGNRLNSLFGAKQDDWNAA